MTMAGAILGDESLDAAGDSAGEESFLNDGSKHEDPAGLDPPVPPKRKGGRKPVRER